jgi:hypothetical protein
LGITLGIVARPKRGFQRYPPEANQNDKITDWQGILNKVLAKKKF